MCAASTASTRSLPFASPSAAIAALAIDYFGRTAGVAKRDDDFEYMPHVDQTTRDGIQADVAAAVDTAARGRRCTRSSPSASASAAELVAPGGVGPWPRRRHRLLRAPRRGDGAPGPIDRAAEMTCPILALQAGDDQNITADDNAAFDARPDRRRRRARGRHLRRRAAQLLRPQARGVRRRVRRRLAADARVHRAALVILAIDQGTTGTTCLVVDDGLNVARPRVRAS